MKLLVVITKKEDEKKLLDALNKEGLSATMLEAEGIFLKKKSNVFLVGVEDNKTEKVIKLIKKCCAVKKEHVTPAPTTFEPGELLIPEAETIKTSGAVIFVLEVSKIIKT